MQILLTHHATERYGDLIRGAAPDAGWLVMDPDGALRADAGNVEWEDAAPDVAWIDAGVYESGLVRKYFGFLTRCPTLEWIQSSGAGTDHPVFGALVANGATLTSAHVGDVNISEYVLGMVLAHCQGHERWRQNQRQQLWQGHEIREIEGLHWLVIGVGAIGGAVAHRTRAFGCRVTGVRRTPTGDEPVDEMIAPDGVLDAVPAADVVVLCAPATDATEHLVDAAFLAAMKPRSILVNIARGALVDEDALLTALDTGVPEVAILDVTREEPLPPDHPLWRHDRVVLTPHSSGRGDGHHRRGAAVFADNLRRFVAGDPLANVVTAELIGGPG